MRLLGSLTSGAKGRTLGLLVGLLGTTASLWTATADAQEAPECRSPNPADWPESSKPYFMLVVDTSSSMLTCTFPEPIDIDASGSCTPGDFFCYPEAGQSCPFIDGDTNGIRDNVNSCGLEPTRLNDAKCALLQTVQAFGGEVNFGLATYAAKLSGCTGGACGDSCTAVDGSCSAPVAGSLGAGEFYSAKSCTMSPFANAAATASCGNTPSCATAPDQIMPNDWKNGANIVVDMLQDPTWDPASTPSTNVDTLLEWFDGDCANSRELFAIGATPIEGSLNTVYEYFANGWASTWADGNYCDVGGATIDHPTPLDFAQDRPCRSINVIFVTDGAESCGGTPALTAADLFDTGVTIQGQQVPIKTYVIGFAGVDAADVDPIAAAGGTGTALIASNEIELAQAMSGIISGSVSPEVCDNDDNNCNGCTDEGSAVYCNRDKTPVALATLQASGGTVGDCCSYTTDIERDDCLTAFAGSIDAGSPQGDSWFLPCWDPATSSEVPQDAWLCSNPGEICDELDNNCETDVTVGAPNTVDENQTKCPDINGNLVCPTGEVCDGADNDCDDIIDNAFGSGTPGSVCPNNCINKGPDTNCDGCDDDCDGFADEDSPVLSCGALSPPQCVGTQTCVSIDVPNPGDCDLGGNTYGTCVLTGPIPPTDVCNTIDDDCDGIVDEDGGSTPCDIPGMPGLVYNDTNPLSLCERGTLPCNGTCQGGVGPSTEICDTFDNDCDGLVDGADPDMQGVGGPCGTDNGICTKGTLACVGGAPVCTGGTQPQPEVCDGVDNDCDLLTDEAPLADGPSNPGCWETAGTTCTFDTLTWDPPPGATCTGTGTLTVPCQAGTLVCIGATGWECQGAQDPDPEACNGLDDDCDGLPDATDPDVPVGGSCGTDTGECISGTLQCVSGTPTCVGATPAGQEVCDNLDNDCDGVIDEPEDIPGVGEVCGTDTGACQTGLTACVGGVILCTNDIEPGPETCDGIDNNCDGAVDNGLIDAPVDPGCWPVPGTTCSFAGLTWDPPPGATCSGTGTLTTPCSAGTLVCTGSAGWECQGGQVPSTEACDNVDNNCDGAIDDGNPSGGGACGQTDVGECQLGSLVCQSGTLVCIGEVGPQTELCDTLDNDCDGTADDNVAVGVGNSCGTSTGACEKGVTACVNGSIQCTGGVPASPEACNGIDDDCDGLTDEGPLTDQPVDAGCWRITGTTCSYGGTTWDPPAGGTCSSTGTLTAPCAAGTLMCLGGGWLCQGGTNPDLEVCDNVDNNCNGVIDESNPGGGAACGTDVGECVAGTQVCSAGTLSCVGRVGPTVEICDGKDNDCDGETDEASDVAGVGITCGSAIGECTQGITACVNGTLVCNGETVPAPEVCDGLDNNCDGAIDNSPTDLPADPGCWEIPGTSCTFGSLTWDPPAGATCTGLGTLTTPCFTGQLVCDGLNGWQCQGGRVPEASESCDLVDNDCDGIVDEGNPGGGAQCGATDVGICEFGSMTCVNGQLSCTGEVISRTELCNGLDDNCDGSTDENVPGIGNACGVAVGQCQKGTTACISGSLVCQGGVQPGVEICNGIDDDCNGIVDDGLTDSPTNPACWNNPGTTCSYSNETWDPPAGANCTDLGSLTLPCSPGFLQCKGVAGWDCVGGKLPVPEVCDDQDNDCNGTPDDGNLGGGVCGIDTGECQQGTQTCVSGTLVCSNQVLPIPEVCDGLDNDCNGDIDNGIDVGDLCFMPYDTATYPGDRTQGECQQGTLVCDQAGGAGQTICEGGTEPAPEICDGKDNDCDGDIDEAGVAPDGVDGTADPNDPTRVIGATCGTDEGDCETGAYACVNAQVVCFGEKGPQREICDCQDNDCDGSTDEDPAAGEPVLCGAGTSCVAVACLCAPPCSAGEFPCPTGTECRDLPRSNDPTGPTNPYCINPSTICDQCETRTVTTNGEIECGPAGTTTPDGKSVPLCECAGEAGCRGPCFDENCTTAGDECVAYGDAAGECRPSTDCRFFGCADGKACHDGACVDDPCEPNTCTTDVCKPNGAFDAPVCVASCADVICAVGELCVEGACQATGCGVDCMAGEYCLDQGGGTFTCGPSRCTTDVCNGAYCDPLTGQCADEPCEAVQCPVGQVCDNGDCVAAVVTPPPTGGTGGMAGAGGSGGGGSGGGGTGGTTSADGGPEAGAGTAGTTGTGARPGTDSDKVIGLATGGGGCRCEVPKQQSSSPAAWLLAALAVGATAVRRRARREGGAR